MHERVCVCAMCIRSMCIILSVCACMHVCVHVHYVCKCGHTSLETRLSVRSKAFVSHKISDEKSGFKTMSV